MGIGEQTAGAGLDQRGGIGHAADQRQLAAQPLFQGVGFEPGGNGDDERLVLLNRRANLLAYRFHDLRLDGQDHHIGTGDRRAVVGAGLDAQILLQPVEWFDIGAGGMDIGRLVTLLQ